MKAKKLSLTEQNQKLERKVKKLERELKRVREENAQLYMRQALKNSVDKKKAEAFDLKSLD
jgi:hypothetical protein